MILLQNIVYWFAKQSRRDIALKGVIIIATLWLVGFVVDLAISMLGDQGRQFASFWMIVLIVTPLLVFQIGVVGYLSRLQGQLEKADQIDPLTDILNRRAFLKQAHRLRRTSPAGVMFILDVDHMRQINATYGRGAGDVCLRKIAVVLQEHLGKIDLIGRMGNQEFGVYMPDATDQHIQDFEYHMTQTIVVRLDHTDQAIALTLSIGCVHVARQDAFDLVLGRADDALYAAKALGNAKMMTWDSIDIKQAS